MKYAALIATAAAYASEKICPSTECYTQSEPWSENGDVTCDYNPDSGCLTVGCTSSNLAATFTPKLFHSNLFSSKSFAQQVADGDRTIVITSGNGGELADNGPCSYSVNGDNIEIDWSYENCNQFMDLSLSDDGESVVYKVTLEANGNTAENNDVIEFYVDTDVSASCSYPAKVTVNAEGFWINQEDVEAFSSNSSNLEPIFDCEFFADEARTDQIGSDNIVNMGVNIFGKVTSVTPLPGLSYSLTDVRIFNTEGDEFYPIEDSNTNALVNAGFTGDNNAATGSDILFNYLSFGFEDNTGKNQNSVNIECSVKLSVSVPEE